MANAFGTIAGAVLGALPSFFGGNSQEDALHNSAMSMAMQHNYNMASLRQQFQYNKYFTEHGHQAEVSDLRKAGLNPILSANNGAYSNVGLPSAGLPDISAGSSALSQSKSARMHAISNFANAMSDVELKRSNSALAGEQAKTESYKRANMASDTALKQVNTAVENENLKWLPQEKKANLRKVVAEANYNDAMSKAGLLTARSSARSAEASYINATQGSLTKVGSEVGKNIINDLPNNKFTRYLKRIIK